VNPQPETYWGNVNPIGIRGVYDEANRFAEAMAMAYHRHHGVDVRIARIFNTFGPRMQVDDGRAIPNFFRQAIRGEDVTLYGDGSQTRSFIYVDDQVEGILRLLRSDYVGPVNIEETDPLRAMAEKVVALCGGKSRIVTRPLPPDDRSCGAPTSASRARARRLSPQVRVERASRARTPAPWATRCLDARGTHRSFCIIAHRSRQTRSPIGCSMRPGGSPSARSARSSSRWISSASAASRSRPRLRACATRPPTERSTSST
jgi:dTDP-glucose 4,6-dehydratase